MRSLFTVPASVAALAMTFVGLGCGPRARIAPPEEFPPPQQRVDADAVRGIQKICFERFKFSVEIPDVQPRTKAYVDLLRTELARANIVLVGEEQTKPVLERAYRKAGGLYDPATGGTDTARYTRVHKAGAVAMKDELGCDASMTISFPVVRTRWAEDRAIWDGVTQNVPGSFHGAEGWLAALSVWIRLFDITDREIYFGTGGVQLLTELKRRGPYAQPELSVLEMKHWLASSELNKKSVEVALEPMFSVRARAESTSDVLAKPAEPTGAGAAP